MLASSATPDGAAHGALLALLADGDDDTRAMYGQYLKYFRVELDEASDGRQALAKALARKHDIIITETRLPGISGHELCRLLRHDPLTETTPIIVVTGDAMAPNIERAERAGADVVLVKPCMPDVLLTELQRLTAKSRELRLKSAMLQGRMATQLARSQEIRGAIATRRRTQSRAFTRTQTTTPTLPVPELFCPMCDQPLVYQRSHIGGVNERSAEQWDYFECSRGCGTFQYRQRTRKLRRASFGGGTL